MHFRKDSSLTDEAKRLEARRLLQSPTRYVVVLTAWLGKRRGWMLLAQLSIAVGIAAMGVSDPTANVARFALLLVPAGLVGLRVVTALPADAIRVAIGVFASSITRSQVVAAA